MTEGYTEDKNLIKCIEDFLRENTKVPEVITDQTIGDGDKPLKRSFIEVMEERWGSV